jgi:hypothetical protein
MARSVLYFYIVINAACDKALAGIALMLERAKELLDWYRVVHAYAVYVCIKAEQGRIIQ